MRLVVNPIQKSRKSGIVSGNGRLLTIGHDRVEQLITLAVCYGLFKIGIEECSQIIPRPKVGILYSKPDAKPFEQLEHIINSEELNRCERYNGGSLIGDALHQPTLFKRSKCLPDASPAYAELLRKRPFSKLGPWGLFSAAHSVAEEL